MTQINRASFYLRLSLLHTSPEIEAQILDAVIAAFREHLKAGNSYPIIFSIPLHEIDPENSPSIVSIDLFIPNMFGRPIYYTRCRSAIASLSNLPLDWGGEFERWNHEQLTDFVRLHKRYLKTPVTITPTSITFLEGNHAE